MRRRASGPSWIVIIIAAALAGGGCGGSGCSCMAPIPGGFPADERTPNAAQLRVTETGLAALTDDPAALVGALIGGGGGLTFEVPTNCTGDTPTCCPGGNPVTPCGPIEIDLEAQDGDDPRLELDPVEGASQLGIVVRARVSTATPIPVTVIGLECEIEIDTEPGDDPDIMIEAPVDFLQDDALGTTRVEVGEVVITQLTTDDVTLGGANPLCFLADLGLGFFLETLVGTFESAIHDAIAGQVCKACASGDVAECGVNADACTDGVCMNGDACVQELGVTGRMAAGAIFGGFSPGTTGAIDLYEVAGGYADTDAEGLSLGLLGGMLPAGEERDRCGPPATAPAEVTIDPSPFFLGNARPDDPEFTFDIGVGVHEHQLDRFAYAAYDGGFLCLTVGTSTVDLLNTDTISIFMQSLSNLVTQPSPMALGLRPQRPPVIVLGENTFTVDDNGDSVVDDPLLDITFTAMEIDFFAMVEDQYIRVFTLVADVHLPLGLEIGPEGDLVPVLGDLDEAFQNLSAKNTEALLETPEEIAGIFPAILELALPGLAGALGGFAVPELAGLKIDVTAITAVQDKTFLAIFGELSPAASPAVVDLPPRVDTTAEVVASTRPPDHYFDDTTLWSAAARPKVDLALGGVAGAAEAAGAAGAAGAVGAVGAVGLEWQVRVDDGLWSPWSARATRTVSPESFWLEGRHRIEVRARRAGEPRSADLTPVVIESLIDTIAPRAALSSTGGGVWIDGTDAVSAGRLTARWRRGGGGAWREAPAPVEVELGGAAARELEIELVDEAGNVTRVRAADDLPELRFHGAGSGGCDCDSGGAGGGAAGGLGVLLLALAATLGLRRRRRRGGRIARATLVLLAAGALPACNCGGTSPGEPCGPVDCMEGEVERGTIGRWNGIAADDTRVVVTTYDQTLGDLVLVDVATDGGDPVYTAVDGVPDETPTYDPSTYRGGIVQDGDDVGGWTSVALRDGLARIAYQDRVAGELRVAIERVDLPWLTYVVDAPEGGAGPLGLYTSIAVLSDGRPAIAYLATGVDDGAGGRKSQLKLAVAELPVPVDGGDWTVSVVAEAPSSCAGACGALSCIAPLDPATEGEVCAADTGDCAAACGEDELCVDATCRAVVAPPVAIDLPGGTGLFANLIALGDDRLAIVHYDRVRTALVLQLESNAGSGSFGETILDGEDGADRGMWASALSDPGGTVHIAYQDALGDQLFYMTWNGAPGAIENVDDGVREGDRPHPVGAGAAIVLDGDSNPAIAYQDGLTADLVLAERGASWSWDWLSNGPRLDGFHVATAFGGGRRWAAWDALDQAHYPPGDLQISEIP